MKLLWLSHFIPYPPRGGSFQRSFNLLRHVSAEYEVSLVAFNLEGLSAARQEEYRARLLEHCARVEFWELPVPWKSAAWWLRLGLSPFFSRPHSSRSFESAELAERWTHRLKTERPDLVHVDSSDLAFFLQQTAGIPTVLNHHNCESHMVLRRARTTGNPIAKVFLLDQARKQARLEQEVCGLARVNVTVSDSDCELLRANCPRAHVHVVENGTDTEYMVPMRGQEEPGTLVFAGSLRWYPNLSGLRYFVDQVWPLVKRKRPQARLILAGRDPSPAFVRWANQDPAISLVADPEDIRPWVARGAVFVCPILDGGGTRLKILDALALGKAVVSTTIGYEGLRLQAGKELLAADTSAEFADAVLRLLDDPNLCRQLGRAGREAVERLYGWKIISAQLRDSYRCALDETSCTVRSGKARNTADSGARS